MGNFLKKQNKTTLLIVAAVLVIAIGAGTVFAVKGKQTDNVSAQASTKATALAEDSESQNQSQSQKGNAKETTKAKDTGKEKSKEKATKETTTKSGAKETAAGGTKKKKQQGKTAAGATCTLTVDCKTAVGNSNLASEKKKCVPANGVIYPTKTISLKAGDTVFSVLQREMKNSGIHMEHSKSPVYDSAYIEGINNLYEFDCGELSGWMYSVNGKFPNYGCSQYTLKAGDVIAWRYTCNLGKDIGGKGATQ